MGEKEPSTGASPGFPTTQWTVVEEAFSADPKRAREALERLCIAYRSPIVNWFKRKDFYQDPEDLAHSFVAYLLEKSLLKKVETRTGRFRAFLAATMRNFLRDTWDKNRAQKRGHGIEKVPLDENDTDFQLEEDNDNQLDLDFAVTIHERVMGRLSPREELRPYIFDKDPREGWQAVAERMGKTSTAVRQEVSRLRRKHWTMFRDEVAQIVRPEYRSEETRYLYELLFRHPPEQ